MHEREAQGDLRPIATRETELLKSYPPARLALPGFLFSPPQSPDRHPAGASAQERVEPHSAEEGHI